MFKNLKSDFEMMSLLTTIMIIALGGLTASNTVYAQPSKALTFNQFIEHFSQHDLHTQLAVAKYKKELFRLNSDQNQFASTLSLTPKYSLFEKNNSSFSDESEITANLAQNLSTGSTVNLEYSQNFQNFFNLDNSAGNSLSLSVTQSLIRNSFGSKDRTKLKLSKLQQQVKFIEMRDFVLDRCVYAKKLYARAWLLSKRKDLLKKQQKLSRKSHSFIKKNYRFGIIDDLNYQNSQSDQINIDQEHLKLEQDTDALESEIAKSLGSKVSFSNIRTLPSLKNHPKDSYSAKKHSSYAITKLQTQISKLDQKISKDDALPLVDLSASWTRFNNSSSLSSAINNRQINNDLFTFALKAEWDFFQNSKDDLYEASLHNVSQKETEKRLKLRELKTELDALNKKYLLIRKSQALQIKKSKIQNKIDNLAYKNLKNSKINFFQYSQYRDAVIKEQVKSFEIKTEIFNINAELSRFLGSENNSCYWYAQHVNSNQSGTLK